MFFHERAIGPFPKGAILHSYLGSAEMVPALAKLGAYFSVSGHTMSMKPQKARKMLKSVPAERILLESDAPDALPSWDLGSLQWVPGDVSKTLNQPANIHNQTESVFQVLSYAASLLEMPEAELAEISYRNALRLFSCQDFKVNEEG
ncbi:hypothetical protein IFM89_015000 [Coptis chinensis]|uniref:TatD related DNase n=1 Tax=Coptis chinensis TaxID=261450 RepID=A0A835LN11_9MAGN|nr:hypothetical protein IFM89_015000 [Coptis chinensis]